MIALYADRNGNKYRLFVKGHAFEGEDAPLVCAAVSALTGALLSYAAAEDRCRCKRIVEGAGECFLSCRGGLRGAFDMVLLAIEMLAVSHPDNFYPILRTVDGNGTVRWYNATGSAAREALIRDHER